MPMLDLADTRLYYEDTGPGSTGETIVFSHGLLWSTELFAPQIAALRDRYRCIAYDHSGQGKSAADHRHCIGMELVWQDAVAVLERLAPNQRVHFAGLSMGGFVAMRMAARRPELLASLILIETSADPEPAENLGKYRLLSGLTRVLPIKLIASQVKPIMLGKTILADASRRAEVDRYVAIMASRNDAWRATNGVIDRAPITSELARITAPTLILVGDEDLATVPAKAERMRAAIAGATLETIPRAGHSSTVEHPAAVTAAIERFLASLRR